MPISVDEFLRRFLIHVLPKGLVRIRHFGLFANRKRSASLLRCRLLLKSAVPPPQPAPTAQIKCPLCAEPILVVERFTSLQLLSAPQSTVPIKPRLDSSSTVMTTPALNPVAPSRAHARNASLRSILSKQPQSRAASATELILATVASQHPTPSRLRRDQQKTLSDPGWPIQIP